MPSIPVPSDRDRDHLYEKLAQALGVDNADTLMAHLPARRADVTSVDFTNIARKTDLDGLETRLRGELTSRTGSVTTGAEHLKQHIDMRVSGIEARMTRLETSIRSSMEDVALKAAIAFMVYAPLLIVLLLALARHR